MLRFMMIAGLLLGVFSTQAEARTIRYEFDVISSSFGFYGLYQWSDNPYDPTDPPADTAIGPEERAAFTAAQHPLAHLIGQTGSVIFDLDGRLDCVSGFLCSDLGRMNATPGLSGDVFYMNDSSSWWTFHVPKPGTQSPGSGYLDFSSDARIYEIIEWNGGYYSWIDATAGFSLANLTITEIAPVPLPASAAFLVMGLIMLGCKAKRSHHSVKNLSCGINSVSASRATAT